MFLLLPFFSLLPFVSSISDPPRVSTLYGPVRGYTYTADAGFEAEIFKRIPYAKPPLGDGRWHKPVAPDKWAIELDATVMGPACASSSKEQHPLSGYSEDCLHINVYTSEACRKSPSGCAVVVYAHGGALLIDSPVLFEDEPLVNSFVRNDVVLVTVGYRLGVFGTLALGDENALPANLGLHDFIAALRFTREIIAEFGGDVDRITLMGHSSGGEMALEAALSPAVSPPGVKPLFSSVISMSGLLVLQSEEEQIMKTRKFALAAGCSGSAAEIIPCLHTKTTEEILTAQGATGGAAPMGDEQLGRIVMTGELFPIRRQLEVLENPVPFRLLTGSTLDEMSAPQKLRAVFGSIPEKASTSKDSSVPGFFHMMDYVNLDDCYSKYLDDVKSGHFDNEGHALASSEVFLTNYVASIAQVRRNNEVYLYQYDYPAHAYHVADLMFIMGIHPFPKDANEEWLSRIYPVYFTNFVKGLAPAPDWDQFDPDLNNYYSINKSIGGKETPHMQLHYQHKQIDYWTKEMRSFDKELTIRRRAFSSKQPSYHSFSHPFPPPRWTLKWAWEDFLRVLTSPTMIFFGIAGVILVAAGCWCGRCSRRRQRCSEAQPLLVGRTIY